jgi:hypothetical protein
MQNGAGQEYCLHHVEVTRYSYKEIIRKPHECVFEWKYHTSGFLGRMIFLAGNNALVVSQYNRVIRKNITRLDCPLDNGKI